ncbi:hypothetical protein CcrColossus_gp180 [Caulobacter phage CcrColossus]|uniref:Uncharacterized protein n=1 Tax=Caulobacter phage CcrColossus TaxID=1211640 RepID=K4JUM8_9CAUD|nr:hypothetical protein CcrColossus_gp180 [Caulobacter phage CcrColossus]AFU88050.1 hypothetical protein CcrColossus_gp180 [Caulobacter phage CcrColossus]
MSDPRNPDHGPARIPSYGHKYGLLHDRIVGDKDPDSTFHSKISNHAKTEYICQALRLDPRAFNLDLPFPLEDWNSSSDMSLINAGLYFTDMRRQFFEALVAEHAEHRHGDAWVKQGEAEFWCVEFNRTLHKRLSGIVIGDSRVLN